MSRSTGKARVWTVPNLVSGLRLAGTVPLVWVAFGGHRQLVFWVLVVLLASDWVDGKLAVILDQETEVGARLDSAADAVMYTALGICFLWLESDVVRRELGWFVATGVSWAVAGAVALARFGRMPSYHTWGAKASWLVAGVVAVVWLLTGDGRFVPWALGLVILVNLEAVAIGLVLPEWHANVPTVRHAMRIRKEAQA